MEASDAMRLAMLVAPLALALFRDCSSMDPLVRPPRTVIVATPSGRCVALDADSGAVVATHASDAASVVDVAVRGDVVATIEVGDSGHVATYDVATLTPIDATPFDAADGRVLAIADRVIALARGDGQTIFAAVDPPKGGASVGVVASVIPRENGAIVLDLADAPTRYEVTLAGPKPKLAASTPIGLVAGDDARLVDRGGVIATVLLRHGTLSARDEDGATFATTTDVDGSLEDAIARNDGTIVALVGPEARLVIVGGSRRDLGHSLSSSPTFRHLLAYDPAARRVYVALDDRVVGLDAQTLADAGPTFTVGAVAIAISN